MSHIQELTELKTKCILTGDCQPFQEQLAHEDAAIDARTASDNATLAATSVLGALIALIVLFTAFAKPLKTMMSFALPILLMILPIIIGLGVSVFAGFLIAFGACFKQSCSPVENYAMFIAPALSLIVTIPITVVIARRRQSIRQIILNISSRVWVIVGIIFLALTSLTTTLAYIEGQQENTHQKQSLRRYMDE